MEGIVRSVAPASSVDLDGLQADLRDIAISFIIAARTTPIGFADGPARKSHDERKRWLRAHIVNPAITLFEALSDENASMLSEWPESINSEAPDRQVMREELRKLIDRSQGLVDVLEDRKGDRSGLASEFRADLANALTQVFEDHFSDKKAARSSYDRTTTAKSAYVEFLRLCTEEMFPRDNALPGHLVDDITKMRGNR